MEKMGKTGVSSIISGSKSVLPATLYCGNSPWFECIPYQAVCEEREEKIYNVLFCILIKKNRLRNGCKRYTPQVKTR